MHTDRRVKDPKIMLIWIKIKSLIEYHLLCNRLMNDRKAFDKFIYTDIDKAIKELDKRRDNKKLNKKIQAFFKKRDIPNIFLDKKGKLILLRQLATPNFETTRFMIASDAIGIEPMILEYLEDKFSAHNVEKKSLGRLLLLDKINKYEGAIFKKMNIIDFQKSDGKKISEVKTILNENLVKFHHDLFNINFPNHSKCYLDGSDWLKKITNVKKRYEVYISMFISNNILFENFYFDSNKEDREFTKKILLPSFIMIKNTFKIKPLIVALEPTHLEGDSFWLCHNHKTQKNIYDKINSNEHNIQHM